jgi:hypothetical protein|tara:strand:- start:525 stop:797 length:273 start_codon:yes stop_codon:yes gene_type:complete
MMNERDSTNRATHFVVQVSEMVAAYNDRGISIEMEKLLEDAYANEYVGMKNEDLPYALDIFNEDFADPDAGWLYVECKSIRKWIGEKFYK